MREADDGAVSFVRRRWNLLIRFRLCRSVDPRPTEARIWCKRRIAGRSRFRPICDSNLRVVVVIMRNAWLNQFVMR